MAKKELQITYHEYSTIEDLSTEQQLLLQAARKVVHDAYNPYSKFYVGCSILLSNQKIVTGFNIENASYPVCICAERTALSSAIVQFPNEKIIGLAISTFKADKQNNEPAFPCGVCRQFISECEDRNSNTFPIIISGQSGPIIVLESIKHILPFHFGKTSLEQ